MRLRSVVNCLSKRVMAVDSKAEFNDRPTDLHGTADGISLTSILRELNEKGAKRVRSERPFTTSSLFAILANELYVSNTGKQLSGRLTFNAHAQAARHPASRDQDRRGCRGAHRADRMFAAAGRAERMDAAIDRKQAGRVADRRSHLPGERAESLKKTNFIRI